MLLDRVNFKPAKCPQQNMDELALVLSQLGDCMMSHVVLMCNYIISWKYSTVVIRKKNNFLCKDS